MGDENDGLNDSEATKLLFKNFMNYTSTSQYREFYEEGDLANHSNIYSKGVLTDTPPIYYNSPVYISIDNDVSLSEYLQFSGIDDISINNEWFSDKKSAGGSFSVNDTDDDNRRILRLEKIKLDFLGSGTKAFVCKDNNDINILQNLIPPNYSTYGYSLQLFVKNYTTGAISEMTWLSTATSCNTQTGLTGNDAIGAPLFDAKNGVITFYDIGTNVGDLNFATIELYLTATKYIGLSDVKTLRSLDVIGDLSVGNDLNVTERLTIGSMSIDVESKINSLETTTTDISYSANDTTTIFENNVRVNGSLDVSDTFYVDSSSGNIGIGTSVPSYTLHIDGDVYTSVGIGVGKERDSEYELDVSGDIHCSGTLFADSDLNVKKNLVPLDNALDKISKLNGYYYHKVGEKDDSMRHVGVIAQEVEAEYPELVSKNTDIKSVNYDGINAILIECVKELRKENMAIKSELEKLKTIGLKISKK